MRNRTVIFGGTALLIIALSVGAWLMMRKPSGDLQPGSTKKNSNSGITVEGLGVEMTASEPATSSVGGARYAAPDPMTGQAPEIPKELLDRMKYSDSRVSAYLGGNSQEGASSSPSVLPVPVPADPSRDTDGDGLSDAEEVAHRTDAKKKDTDGDGLSDGDEVNRYRTNPRTIDTDGDGLSDGEEIAAYKTNPNLKDTDGDGYDDGTEVKTGYNPLGPGKR
jgi:hypothetical protein